jgi:hypothetical protein
MKADGRPAFKISGSVHGKGRTRTLTFSTNGQPGYSFDLSEAGKAVGQPLAVLRGRATGITATHGSLTFLPGDAPGAARSIQATIYHDGVPVRVQTLARFAAPPRVMPGRVAALSVKRARGGLQIRWRQATNCERYELKVKVKGRETFIFMPRASTTTQFIPGVTAPAGAKITIRGVHLGFRYGRTSTLILRPPAKKKPHRPSKPHKKRRHG